MFVVKRHRAELGQQKHNLRIVTFTAIFSWLLISIGPVNAQPAMGAYVWGGLLGNTPSVDNFARSVQFVLDRGFTAVRFAVTPESAAQYGVQACRQSRSQLACVLRMLLSAPAFVDSRLRVVAITMHEFGYDQRTIVDASYLESVKSKVAEQYDDALVEIANRFSGRDVTVIISNWEGDNIMLCGSAFDFVANVGFANKCRANQNVQHRKHGVQAWLAFRDEVIASALKRYPNLNILHAPELNNVVLFSRVCRHACDLDPSILGILERKEQRPVCSYSAYDSLHLGVLATSTDRILRSCQRLVLGEVGFPLALVPTGSQLKRAESIVHQVREVARSIDVFFIWNAFGDPNNTKAQFGLFTGDGQAHTFRWWQRFLR